MRQENYCDKTELKNGMARVSIGMPVFNGEKYIGEALDSILTQTYTDFEVIISDNASTDSTRQICLEYAARDARVRYYRNKKNLGSSRNFNRVFELSTGEYFKWAAYDDVIAADFLQKCVDVLDKDPSIVLCHSKTARIDERGKLVGTYDYKTLNRIGSLKPHERFADLISIRNLCWQIFGVARASSLRLTSLFGNYIGADHNLLAELGLMGRMYEIPEHLFFRRDHPEAYTRRHCEQQKFAVSTSDYVGQMAWWAHEYVRFPWWKSCFEYFRAVRRVPLKWSERVICYSEIYDWILREGWMFMGGDIERFCLQRSRFGRKLASIGKLMLHATVIPIINRVSGM